MVTVGIAFRPELAPWIDSRPAQVGCLEIIAEPFSRRESQHHLRRLSALYPLIVRGMELSLGTPGPIDQKRLDGFVRVVQAADPLWVTEHIGFRRTGEVDLGYFCPLPPDPTTIGILADHVGVLGERCAKPVVLEPITAELRIAGRLSETEFLNRLCEAAGCGLLLDVTSLFVNSHNHGFDARDWLRDIDPHRIVQLHVAGYSRRNGRWEDAHREAVEEDICDLVDEALTYAPVQAVVLERDENFPPVGDLESELNRLGTVARSMVPAGDRARAVYGRRVMAGPRAGDGLRDPIPTSDRMGDADSRPAGENTGNGPVRPADDASLLILDDGGIFFSESQQELHSFNTAAAIIWCAIEEGLTPDAIAARFADAFGTPKTEAERVVADLIHRWQGLGFVSGFEHPCPPDVDFITVLGRLLTNASLRHAFAHSPVETARRLRIRDKDRDALIALDARGLELQARLIGARKRMFRDAPLFRGNASTTSFLRRLRSRDRPSLPIRRHYRLLTTVFRLRFQTASQEEWVHPVFAHLEIDAPGWVDASLDLVEEDRGHILLENGVPMAHCPGLDQVVPSIQANFRQISVNRHSYGLKIHAGVVSNGKSCLLLPAPPGSGKTVLTGALARSGFDYLSDEITLLDEGTLAVRPMPLGMAVKEGALEALSPYYPGVRELPAHLREDEQVVRYLTPPPPTRQSGTDVGLPVRWIVFPRYAPGADTVLAPIGRIEAFHRLMQELMVLPSDLDRPKVASVVNWMRKVACFDLSMSSVAEAVHLIRAKIPNDSAAPKRR